MKRIHIDKIASATSRLNIARHALISDDIVAEAGAVIAVRVLDLKEVYDKLEERSGRMVRLYPGDIVAGVLGERRALHGHEGIVPDVIKPGDTLHMLNLGGVIGHCIDSHPDVGPAMRVEVLGAVLSFPVMDSRVGEPAHMKTHALPAVDQLDTASLPPLIFVSGTAMNSGKTRVASELVRALSRRGKRVGAAKLTGVALQRDVLSMLDCGAHRVLSFTDAGLPSTTAATAPAAARAVITGLAAPDVTPLDVVVVEFGDGLLGEYGVLEILTQPDIRACCAVHVCCANDPVGALGACQIFETHLDGRPDVFSGPVTDHRVGARAIADHTGVPAFNVIQDPEALANCVVTALNQRIAALRTPPSTELNGAHPAPPA